MYAVSLFADAEAVIFERLRMILADDRERRTGGRFVRGQVSGHYDHDAEGMVNVKGGAWNMDPSRMAFGFTLDDLRALRVDLAKVGVKVTIAESESLLTQARAILESNPRAMSPRPAKPLEEKRAKWREKRRKQRAAARAAGICIICIRNPADTGKATCWECGQRANAKRKQ